MPNTETRSRPVDKEPHPNSDKQAAGTSKQEIAMNSIHRIALTIAGIATAVTVAGAFVVQGYVAAQQAQTQATAMATTAATTLPTQIVYINPAPIPAASRGPLQARR